MFQGSLPKILNWTPPPLSPGVTGECRESHSTSTACLPVYGAVLCCACLHNYDAPPSSCPPLSVDLPHPLFFPLWKSFINAPLAPAPPSSPAIALRSNRPDILDRTIPRTVLGVSGKSRSRTTPPIRVDSVARDGSCRQRSERYPKVRRARPQTPSPWADQSLLAPFN